MSVLDGVPYVVIDQVDALPYPTTAGTTFVRLPLAPLMCSSCTCSLPLRAGIPTVLLACPWHTPWSSRPCLHACMHDGSQSPPWDLCPYWGRFCAHLHRSLVTVQRLR